jgi:glycosyltransferase 2 family protein
VRRTWRWLAGALLAAATVYWLGRLIAANRAELRGYEWRADLPLLAGSVVALTLVLAAGVWGWGRTLRRFEHPPVRTGTLQRIWFLGNLARYVPGKVFQFVAVAQLGRAAGLSGAVLLTSLLVHTGMALLGAAVLASWTLSGGLLAGVDPRLAGVAVAAGALLAVHPAFLDRMIGLVPRLLKRETIRWRGRWIDGVELLGLSVANWMLYGVAYHLFVASVAQVPWALLPEMAGVNALSFLIGYASPLPGGAGLREVAMAELLRPFLPDGVAAVLSIASRLWTIAAELVGGALALALVRGGAVEQQPR